MCSDQAEARLNTQSHWSAPIVLHVFTEEWGQVTSRGLRGPPGGLVKALGFLQAARTGSVPGQEVCVLHGEARSKARKLCASAPWPTLRRRGSEGRAALRWADSGHAELTRHAELTQTRWAADRRKGSSVWAVYAVGPIWPRTVIILSGETFPNKDACYH